MTRTTRSTVLTVGALDTVPGPPAGPAHADDPTAGG